MYSITFTCFCNVGFKNRFKEIHNFEQACQSYKLRPSNEALNWALFRQLPAHFLLFTLTSCSFIQSGEGHPIFQSRSGREANCEVTASQLASQCCATEKRPILNSVFKRLWNISCLLSAPDGLKLNPFQVPAASLQNCKVMQLSMKLLLVLMTKKRVSWNFSTDDFQV